MKLFLTSAGLTTKAISDLFLKELGKKPEDCKGLVIAYAKGHIEEFYINESKQGLIALGLKNITVANLHYAIAIDKFGRFDFIYVCGGNTFAIMKKMREIKLDKFIVEQVKNGTIYAGVSAGSIIAGKSIEIAGWGSQADQNDVNLEDLKGFGFTNIAIFPHFKGGLKQEAEEFKKLAGYPVIELNDSQAVFCEDEKCKIIG